MSTTTILEKIVPRDKAYDAPTAVRIALDFCNVSPGRNTTITAELFAESWMIRISTDTPDSGVPLFTPAQRDALDKLLSHQGL